MDTPQTPDGPDWSGYAATQAWRDAAAERDELAAQLLAERTAHAELRGRVSRALVVAARRFDLTACRQILAALRG